MKIPDSTSEVSKDGGAPRWFHQNCGNTTKLANIIQRLSLDYKLLGQLDKMVQPIRILQPGLQIALLLAVAVYLFLAAQI